VIVFERRSFRSSENKGDNQTEDAVVIEQLPTDPGGQIQIYVAKPIEWFIRGSHRVSSQGAAEAWAVGAVGPLDAYTADFRYNAGFGYIAGEATAFSEEHWNGDKGARNTLRLRRLRLLASHANDCEWR
jgi:hypothetical protein